jgi:hypothetical protein
VTVRAGLFIAVLFGACGPNYYFDKGPSPDWIRAKGEGLIRQGGAFLVVGSAVATPNPQEDFVLAERDALARLSQMIQSEISSREEVWEASAIAGKREERRLVFEQEVKAKSRISIEGAKVVRRFRDKETRTAYVMVEVDKGEWVARVKDRVSRAMTEDIKSLALDKGKPLRSLQLTKRAFSALQTLAPDIAVLSVLAPDDKVLAQTRALIERLKEIETTVLERFAWIINVDAPSSDVSDKVAKEIRTFLSEKGFVISPSSALGRIVVKGYLKVKYMGSERVANRIEQVYGAEGRIVVMEADGSEVPALGGIVDENSARAQDISEQIALRDATMAGAQGIVGLFRSKFRLFFGYAQ